MSNKLALGTVQFGLNYGVANQAGRVSLKKVESILDFAKTSDIDTLDTAPGYGNSEQVLGEVGVNEYRVITKTMPLENSVDEVLSSFYKSLKNLGKNKVEGLLIHNINDIYNKNFGVLFNELTKLRQDGLIGKIGFSTYMPEQVNFLLDSFDFDLIQIPLNVFDSRLVEGGQIPLLKKNNVEIHVRSVFLQGVLLNFNSLPDYFSKWSGQFEKYQLMVEASGLSLMEYALGFALNIQEVDKVLVGVDNEEQIKEIVQAAKSPKVVDAYPIHDVNLLNPSLWKV